MCSLGRADIPVTMLMGGCQEYRMLCPERVEELKVALRDSVVVASQTPFVMAKGCPRKDLKNNYEEFQRTVLYMLFACWLTVIDICEGGIQKTF